MHILSTILQSVKEMLDADSHNPYIKNVNDAKFADYIGTIELSFAYDHSGDNFVVYCQSLVFIVFHVEILFW